MPHVIVKLWPGKSEHQKQELADKITRAVTETLDYGEESVSVALEEVPAREWMAKEYDPDIRAKAGSIYETPGYTSV